MARHAILADIHCNPLLDCASTPRLCIDSIVPLRQNNLHTANATRLAKASRLLRVKTLDTIIHITHTLRVTRYTFCITGGRRIRLRIGVVGNRRRELGAEEVQQLIDPAAAGDRRAGKCSGGAGLQCAASVEAAGPRCELPPPATAAGDRVATQAGTELGP